MVVEFCHQNIEETGPKQKWKKNLHANKRTGILKSLHAESVRVRALACLSCSNNWKYLCGKSSGVP